MPGHPDGGYRLAAGWRLTFGGEDLGWEGALTTIVEDADSTVFCVLYDIAPTDERVLDRWEGADIGLYSKIRLRVKTLDGDALAWLYVLDAYEGGLPSARYLGVIADAAETAGAPEDYVSELRSRPCRSPPDRAARPRDLRGLARGADPASRDQRANPAERRQGATPAPRAPSSAPRPRSPARRPRSAASAGRVGRTPSHTPSRASAPGAWSRYTAKSSAPIDWWVRASPPGPARATALGQDPTQLAVVHHRRDAAR